jgi:cytochrome c553
MDKSDLLVLALATACLCGCGNIERSRNLADARVAPATLAEQVCSNCHGFGGNAVSPNFPNLAAQVEPYVIAQLNGFKSHGRRDPAGFEYMWGLSRRLTEQQINGLAAYYAAQPPVRQPVEGDRSRLEAGKSIFENGVADKGIPACAGCHGAKGEGNAAFPRIAGQHVDYIVKQLLVFQRTDERPEGTIMKTVAHALTQQHIRDVATYLQAMPNM